MIKRLNKSKKSKQGAILIIVVLILALAMIFIASAMMLTQSTRRRLYSETMKSQARLTVTSASEVFLEALKMQEITDTQIESIMGQTHGAGKSKVKMVVPGVPGMSEAADNCTYLDIYADPTNADIVYCDFTTIIGNQTENVQVVLKAEKEEPAFGTQFKNQVEVAGGVGVGELRFTRGCGMWDASKISAPTDNNIVMRGSYKGQTSSSQYFSDAVFGQDAHDVQLGGGEKFYGRMVFLQGSQMSCRSSADVYGDIYLIGKDNSAGLALKDPGQAGLWDNLSGKKNNFVFSGRSVQNDNDDQNKKIYGALTNGATHNIFFVDASGNSLGATHNNMKGKASDSYSYDLSTYSKTNKATLSGMAASVKRYQGWNYSSASNPFPSASSVFSKLCPDGKTATSNGSVVLTYATHSPDGSKSYPAGTTIPNGQKYVLYPVTTTYPNYMKTNGAIDADKVINLNSISSSVNLAPGYYYITGDSNTVSLGDDSTKNNPIVIGIDGSVGDEYRFYFAANHTFTLRGVIFAVYNANAQKPVLFIMEDGARLQLSHANDGGSSKLCTAGFLSIPNRPGCNNFTSMVGYINSTSWDAEAVEHSNNNFKDNNGNLIKVKYSKYYDNIVRPSVFLYGVNNNILACGPNVILEAYMGLYGNSGFGPLNVDARVDIYGRIECGRTATYTNFVAGYDNPVGNFSMPYCPQPVSDNSLPKQRIAKSKYSVLDVIYYYGGESAPATT